MKHRMISALFLVFVTKTVMPFANAAQSAVVSFNYGSYTSDYMRVEVSGTITFWDAGPLCRAQGEGWDLAGIYLEGAQNVITPILANSLNYAGYFGGMVPPDTTSQTFNQFVWTAGRNKGVAASTGTGSSLVCLQTYCNYNTGEPNALPCTNGYASKQSVNQIYVTGKWDDVEPTDCGGPSIRNAALCERPSCAIALDCVGANTFNMSGSYYPFCTCNCKPGYRGARCEVLEASYFEDGREFAAWCDRDSSSMNSTVAAARCAAQGPGWVLPSITSSTIQDALKDRTLASFWTGGKYDSVLNEHSWRYGRHAGQTFSKGLYPTLTLVMFANWAANQPDHGNCGDGSPLETDVAVSASGTWNDLWSNGCGLLKGRLVHCFACERSACLLSDCPPRTSHVSGYYPNCVCQTETPTQSLYETVSSATTVTTMVTLSISPKTTTTATLQPSNTASIAATLTVTQHPTVSASGSATASGTETSTPSDSPTASATSSPTPSESMSTSASAAGSLSVPASNTQSESLKASDSPTAANTISLSASLTRLPSRTSSELLSLSTSSLITYSVSLSGTPAQSASSPRTDSQHSSQSLGSTHTASSLKTPTHPLSHTASAVHTRTFVSTPTVSTMFTSSPTYAPNATLVGRALLDMPLFGTVRVAESDVRQGISFSIRASATGLFQLLLRSSSASTKNIPVLAQVPYSSGLTGSPDGFFKSLPTFDLALLDASNLSVSISPLPSFEIKVDEGIGLFTSLRGLIGSDADLVSGAEPDALVLMGHILCVAEEVSAGTPSVVTTVVAGGSAVAAGMAAELQGVGALAMMGCADPNSKSSFGSYRVLSPVAVLESYAGVVVGNALLVAAVCIVQMCVVGALRACRRVSRLIDLMSAARFPSLLISAALAFQTGTAYASSQLVSRTSEFEAWEVLVGAVGTGWSVCLPVFLMIHPYLRVGRAYQSYEMAEWMVERGLPQWAARVMPMGAIYSDATRKAYGGYVGRYRAPPNQIWWNGMQTWTPLVFFVGGLFHPNTVPGCQALFVSMGLVELITGTLVVVCAPLLSDAGGWLDASSRVVLGGVMFAMAGTLVEGGPVQQGASRAALILAYVLIALTVLRVVHFVLCWYVHRRISLDGVLLSTVWTHIPGERKTVSQKFATDGNGLLELQTLSADQDEVDVLHEESDATPSVSDDKVAIEMELVTTLSSSIEEGDGIASASSNLSSTSTLSTTSTLSSSMSLELLSSTPRERSTPIEGSDRSVDSDDESSML